MLTRRFEPSMIRACGSIPLQGPQLITSLPSRISIGNIHRRAELDPTTYESWMKNIEQSFLQLCQPVFHSNGRQVFPRERSIPTSSSYRELDCGGTTRRKTEYLKNTHSINSLSPNPTFRLYHVRAPLQSQPSLLTFKSLEISLSDVYSFWCNNSSRGSVFRHGESI